MAKPSLIACCLILLAHGSASADTQIRPRSYPVVTSDGKFVFIMIAPVSAEDDGAYEGPEKRGESQSVRARYKVSGLYVNDGSTAPLWTADWYAHFVMVASDGRHLIRRGYWTDSVFDEALTFFEDGKEVCSYRVVDLFYTSRGFPTRMERFFWYERAELDESLGRLTLITTLGDKYVFDYATGALISNRRPVRALLAVGGILAVAAVIAFWRRKGISKTAA